LILRKTNGIAYDFHNKMEVISRRVSENDVLPPTISSSERAKPGKYAEEK